MTSVVAEGDYELADTVVEVLEYAEVMIIDSAVAFPFMDMDRNEDGNINVDEALEIIYELDLDENEAYDFLTGMEQADADGDKVVSYDEFYAWVWMAVKADAELRRDIMQSWADLVDEYDVDCSADGVAGCDDERAAARLAVDELTAE